MKYKTIKVIDHESTGEYWRQRRESEGMSLRETARRSCLSAPFLSDLERGRRNWTATLEAKYERVISKWMTENEISKQDEDK